ncbi:MAG: cytochrome-c peroxidase [Bacteroidetes bacterium 37-13]|nr:MAG: cytochrome-c peroxidase [Bacteroidetes bacterium 37-13]
MKKLLYTIPVLLFAILQSCTNTSAPKPDAEATPATDTLLKQAQSIFQALPVKAENPNNLLTEEKILLGKALYHDSRLSKTGKNSCSSCHNLNTYGVDRLSTSPGDAGKNGERNSPTVLNAALHAFQFWDGRAKDVEEQAGGPILNPVEMNVSSKDFLVNRLKGIKEYNELFAKAFPNEKTPLTYDNIQNAIGAFERTLLTPSPFDEYLNGKADALTAKQKEGLNLFMATGCQTCHFGVAVGGNMFQKFGVFDHYWNYTKSAKHDEGKFEVSKDSSDQFMFKTSSLRNIAETYPYFHDGSVAELKDAVKIMAKVQLNKDLNDSQIDAITEFLKSLTGTVPAGATDVPAWVEQVKN